MKQLLFVSCMLMFLLMLLLCVNLLISQNEIKRIETSTKTLENEKALFDRNTAELKQQINQIALENEQLRAEWFRYMREDAE